VGYWLFDQHPNDVGLFKKLSYKSKRFDATNVIHLFDCKRPGQIRGLPDGLSAFTRIKNLDEFQDARLDLMKIAACFVGAVTQDIPGPGANKTAKAGDPLPDRVQPGLLLRLNANEKLEFNQPPNVSGQDNFVSEELRLVAAVFGISYEALTGDYSKVNFTSGRMGWLSMHTKQQSDRTRMIVPLFLNRIWKWLQEALELEGVKMKDFSCQWIPPRREMFDPGKEIPPLIKQIRAGLKPMQRALIEQGDNPQTILSQYQEWNKWLDDQTMIFDTDPRRVSGAGNTNPIPEMNDEDDD
jgi:lambda family phage portal protein